MQTKHNHRPGEKHCMCVCVCANGLLIHKAHAYTCWPCNIPIHMYICLSCMLKSNRKCPFPQPWICFHSLGQIYECFLVSKLKRVQQKHPLSWNPQFWCYQGYRGVSKQADRKFQSLLMWDAQICRCMELIPFPIIPSLLPPESRLHVLKIISSVRVIEWAAAFKWNWWNGGVCADGKCVYKYAPRGQRLIPIDSAAVCIQHRWETAASVGNQLAQIHDKSYCLRPLISAGEAQPLQTETRVNSHQTRRSKRLAVNSICFTPG